MEYISLELLLKNKTKSFIIGIFLFALFKSLLLALTSILLIVFIFNVLKVKQKKHINPFLLKIDDEDDDVYIPSIYAHRGAGSNAPENTLSAVKLVFIDLIIIK